MLSDRLDLGRALLENAPVENTYQRRSRCGQAVDRASRPRCQSGADIANLSDDALAARVQSAHAFGRLVPEQRSRLVKAVQGKGAIVGYLGEEINDAPALKAVDIGLSVKGATGVTQAASDMILLDYDLAAVADGADEWRRTFANILRYVRMGASSNFSNMLSMAAAEFQPTPPTGGAGLLSQPRLQIDDLINAARGKITPRTRSHENRY